jgi:hypothetical protein
MRLLKAARLSFPISARAEASNPPAHAGGFFILFGSIQRGELRPDAAARLDLFNGSSE